MLINHVDVQLRKQGKEKEEILEAKRWWINRQTDDGFTVLHFAAYRGNIRMIEYL